MSIPNIKLTMLGAQGSGKTTFLHGMYATLSAGVRGYFLYARDPDVDLDLSDAWDLLCDEGELPPPTNETPMHYDFVFRYGLESLLNFDCVDFRGGAMVERAGTPDAAQDVAALHARLKESDSIYLVLDGHHVGRWIQKGCPAGGGGQMRVARLSRYINDAIGARVEAGLPTPSFVVLITKADVLPGITGLSKGQAVTKVLENLENLVPVACAKNVTAMVCPVQLGNFGERVNDVAGRRSDPVDPEKMDPRFLHKPLIFSLMHYLIEQVAFDSRRLEQLGRERTAAETELSQLRGGFLSNVFKRTEIRDAAARIDSGIRDSTNLSRGLDTAKKRSAQLMLELEEMPIFKNGVMQ